MTEQFNKRHHQWLSNVLIYVHISVAMDMHTKIEELHESTACTVVIC
jgi:hypothetical protein